MEDDPLQGFVERTVDSVFAAGDELYFTPQVARESWAVLTRPSGVGGYGRSPSDAALFLGKVEKVFAFLPDRPEVYIWWLDLVKANEVSGRQVHDAYHVAAMMAHGLKKVLTLDKRDFGRYSGIEVVFPVTA